MRAAMETPEKMAERVEVELSGYARTGRYGMSPKSQRETRLRIFEMAEVLLVLVAGLLVYLWKPPRHI